MFKKMRFETQGGYSVEIENSLEAEKTQLGVAEWQLIFRNKQEVLDHIEMLQKALEFWVYD